MNRLRSLRPLLLTSLGLFASALIARAELKFETDTIKHEAQIGEEQFVAKFPFTNEGDTTVTVIGEPRSSCGCTVTALEQKVYEPGESGEISATFTYGSRTGRQIKTITLRTDSGEYRATLEVVIPTRWEISPRIQTWRQGEELTEKTFEISFSAFSPSKVLLGEYPQAHYETTTNWDAENKVFTASFKPLNADSNGVEKAFVQVIGPDGQVEVIQLYLRVI
jgi:hypothetical protein